MSLPTMCVAGQRRSNVLVVLAVADRGDVVEQRVEPHVDDVRLVPRDLDAPVEARARDRQVAEPLAHERDDLVARRLRLHELRPLLVERQQLLGELAHPEEVVLLLQQLQRLGVDGADLLALVLAGAVDDLALRLELLAADAVERLVLAGVDEAVVVELLQELLDVVLVPLVGRADEVVVGDVDGLQQRQPLVGDQPVGPLLRRRAVGGGRAQDLLPVLVGAGQQPGVVARLAVPAGQDIGGDLGVGVPDVRDIIHVEDRRGDVERRAVGHADHPRARSDASGRVTRFSEPPQRWSSAAW